MNKKSIHVLVSPEFYRQMEAARADYSRQLNRDISNPELTRIWGEGKLARFKVPKLRFKKWQ